MASSCKIEIGIVVDSGNIGGIQKIAFQEAKLLNKMWHHTCSELVVLDKRFLLSSDNKVKPLVPKSFLDVKIPPFGFLRVHHILLLLYFAYKLRKYDIVISHNIVATLPALLSKLIYGKPPIVIIYYHDTAYSIISLYFNKMLIRKTVKILENRILRYADAVIANSHITRKIIEAIYGFRPFLLYPGAEYEKKLNEKIKKDIDIIFVTRWSKHRNIPLILKIAKKFPDLNIVVAGSWSDEESLRKFLELIRNNKVKNIKIIARNLSEEELIRLYRRSRLYIQTEPVAFGMGALEALLNRCISFVWKQSGISWLFLSESLKELIVSSEEELLRRLETFVRKGLSTEEYLTNLKLNLLREKYSWKEHIRRLLNYVLDSVR